VVGRVAQYNETSLSHGRSPFFRICYGMTGRKTPVRVCREHAPAGGDDGNRPAKGGELLVYGLVFAVAGKADVLAGLVRENLDGYAKIQIDKCFCCMEERRCALELGGASRIYTEGRSGS
jgi:hypothetical protein